MAITDNTLYGLTGAQIKDLASKVEDKADSSSLATVATSGSYNDLSNKPTIPTVNNATLTIQKNGSSAGTFTANASSNKTINITVPTTAADVSALPSTTKYGASISVSIDTTNYKITTTLKDQDGNTLGTAQTIDLPLESVVVSGSYDSTNKKIVLTLQGGSTIGFSVADLVSGLQSEITSNNKLSADLVDDSNSAHKFTTASDITKLAGIASGAEVNVNADWNATSGDAQILNKPTIPTVNNATLTIQKNGSTVNTFTANASSNVTANITVPTKTSELTNDSNFVTTTNLATKVNIASTSLEGQTTTLLAQIKNLGANGINYGRFYTETDSGSSGISDKPTGNTNASFVCVAYQSRNNGTTDYTYQVLCWVQNDTNPYRVSIKPETSSISWSRVIPTVNNATLTIQKNGSNVQTFTANQSSNATANITVPTKVSDLTSDAGGNVFVGTCDTAAATAAKDITISSDQNFTLKKGVVIAVKYTNSNSASSVTLNVNGLGAKSIWWNNAAYTGSSQDICGYANRYNYYTYDGTYWVWTGKGQDNNTTYSNMSVAEGQAGTATSQRTMRADYLKQIIEYYAPPVITITKTLDGKNSWTNTGIAGPDLETGTYAIQVTIGGDTSFASMWNEHFSGVMSWFAGNTNSANSEEILLHNAGHADNTNEFYLRTKRDGETRDNKKYLSLQYAFKNDNSSSSATITFKFRRLI